jgi:hypothetical protein
MVASHTGFALAEIPVEGALFRSLGKKRHGELYASAGCFLGFVVDASRRSQVFWARSIYVVVIEIWLRY